MEYSSLENFDELAVNIYNILTSRKFRAGALPFEKNKELITEKIKLKITENKPIELLQFWGGCKNPNLPIDYADICEEATLNNLNKFNFEVKKIYPLGLKIWICPGDSRVEKVNLIPHKKTQKYIQTLTKIAEQKKYNGLFKVTPLSDLYKKYHYDFEKTLKKVKDRISGEIENHENFEKLAVNARKNIFTNDLKNKKEIKIRSVNSARNYIIYRIAEEESQIFKEFKNCIRSFSIKYIPFYKQYIKNINQTIPRLDCSLVFFTGKKGNITQPWQAIGRKNGEEIIFLSQKRLGKLK